MKLKRPKSSSSPLAESISGLEDNNGVQLGADAYTAAKSRIRQRQDFEYAALIEGEQHTESTPTSSSIMTMSASTALLVDDPSSPQLPHGSVEEFSKINGQNTQDSETQDSETPALTPADDDIRSWLLMPSSPSVASEVALSQLPPMDEEQQAAADLLTKGFSIPTFLPPFPVFAVADLPAYLNSVSSTTTTMPTTSVTPPTDPSSHLYVSSKDLHDNLDGSHLELEGVLSQWRPPAIKLQLGANDTVVTVQMGNHAYLPCKVSELNILARQLDF